MNSKIVLWLDVSMEIKFYTVNVYTYYLKRLNMITFDVWDLLRIGIKPLAFLISRVTETNSLNSLNRHLPPLYFSVLKTKPNISQSSFTSPGLFYFKDIFVLTT